MITKRQLRCESLEKRRLLAANCEPFSSNSEAVLVAAEGEQANSAIVAAEGAVTHDLSMPDIGRPDIYFGSPDFVQEVDNRLFVVDQDPYSDVGGRLFVELTSGPQPP